MDFANRNAQHRAEPRITQPAGAAPLQPVSGGTKKGRFGRFSPSGKWLNIGALVVLIGGTVLSVASILSLNFGPSAGVESKYVDKNNMQAVFVNVNGTTGGQVYFGKITSLTKDYIHLTKVFYIQNQAGGATTAQNNQAYSLVKLGCELHGPQDEMIINRSQVFFWENLKSDSQVAKKADEYAKQYPNGQKCDTSQQGATQTTTPAATTQTPATTTTPTTNQ